LDFSEHQIARAKKLHSDFLLQTKSVIFRKGDAHKLTFGSDSFTKIISIEAAQHLESFEAFVEESYRVLKKDGKLGIATFFGKQEGCFLEAYNLRPTIANGTDKLYLITEAEKFLHLAGFSDVKVVCIGENVWKYLDQWICQGSLKNSWDRNWLVGYKKQLFDYYVLVALKSSAWLETS